MKAKLKIIFGILLSAISFCLGITVKLLFKKQREVKHLQNELQETKKMQENFQNIEEKADENKEKLNKDSIDDAVANSFNILRDIKKSKHTSKS